jgi:hypothetical protein
MLYSRLRYDIALGYTRTKEKPKFENVGSKPIHPKNISIMAITK